MFKVSRYLFFYFFLNFHNNIFKQFLCFVFMHIPYHNTTRLIMVSVTFGDHEIAERIMLTKSTLEQKRLGRQVKNFKEDIWTKASIRIVMNGNIR